MTCIIGTVKDGKIYMGSDSAVSYEGREVRTLAASKVFRVGDLLVGHSGALRANQIIRHQLRVVPQENCADDFYMVTQVAESIRECLREHGHSRIDQNQELSEDNYLVGYRSKLYVIEADFAVMQTTDDFEIIGNGRYVAMGAMAALSKLSPKKRIAKALDITAEYVPGVRAPFWIDVV